MNSGAGRLGGYGGFNRAEMTHNLGVANQNVISNRMNAWNRIGVNDRTVLNNRINNINYRHAGWHRGNWNGHYGGWGGNWGGYGRYGGLGYGGYGLGYGYGPGLFGSWLLWGLGTGLGFGLGSSLFGWGLGYGGYGGWGGGTAEACSGGACPRGRWGLGHIITATCLTRTRTTMRSSPWWRTRSTTTLSRSRPTPRRRRPRRRSTRPRPASTPRGPRSRAATTPLPCGRSTRPSRTCPTTPTCTSSAP